ILELPKELQHDVNFVAETTSSVWHEHMSVIPRGKKIYIVRLERNVEVMTVITQIFSVAQSFMWFFFSVNPPRVSPVCWCFVLVDRMLQIFLRREAFEGKFFPAIGTFFRHVVDEHPHYFLRLRAWPLLRILNRFARTLYKGKNLAIRGFAVAEFIYVTFVKHVYAGCSILSDCLFHKSRGSWGFIAR